MKILTHLNARRTSLTSTLKLLHGSVYLRIAVLLGVLLMSTSVTRAGGLLWDWSYQTEESFSSGDFFTGIGTLTTTSTPIDGYYTVTEITGSWTISPGNNPGPTYAITGLISPGGDGGLSGATGENDNLLAAASPQLTNYAGIGFNDSSGEIDAILFANNEGPDGAYRGAIDVAGTPYFDDGGIFNATQVGAVPEPSNGALALLAVALFAYRLVARRGLKLKALNRRMKSKIDAVRGPRFARIGAPSAFPGKASRSWE